jgi:ribosomal protein S12 methylthiotransferase accessory factor
MIEIHSRTKGYTRDLDKACPPEETVARAREALAAHGRHVLAEARRIDTGRLGIPVYMSLCGDDAKTVMPTRKQMGKGASPAQAEASALMELVERYSYFTFWDDESNFQTMTWSKAAAVFGSELMPVEHVLASTGDTLAPEDAVRVLDLVDWQFCRATDLSTGQERVVPLSWFKKLNEFNGSSAGNTVEESVLQGACELVERHVSAIVDREHPVTPTLDPSSFTDPVLQELWKKFESRGIRVWLKDFSLGMPVPTVAALAHDPATFPEKSELVFTAGTATSPEKAAIRALTEVAQLGGDFETGSNYEASGLAKYTSIEETAWIREGQLVSVDSLPDIADRDISQELRTLAERLGTMGFPLYSLSVSHPGLGIPANYNFVPGFLFRERTPKASLGLFTGRILAEEHDPVRAGAGLALLEEVYPGAHFLPFFKGLILLREERFEEAAASFCIAEPLQHDADDKGLAAFYQAYALTRQEAWDPALPHLNRAIDHCPEVKEYFNLRGVALFKGGKYDRAAENFEAALELDSGSAMDLANLGLCHKFMGRTEEAVHCLQNAWELDPELDFAREHLFELLDDE